MDVDQFVDWWGDRRRADLDAILRALEETDETVGGSVCRMRAAHDVDVALRRRGGVRLGSEAAHRATVAALTACRETGLSAADRSAATRLARAAGDAARCLAAGEPAHSTEALLRPFFGAMIFSPA